jgi:methionyl-tRNA formyltransferase
MRVLFIGTGDIGLPTLRALLRSDEHQLVGIVTQPDKPVGRAQRIQPSPIKAAVAEHDIPVLQPERIKRPDAVAEIAALAPDVVVVMAYGQILPRAVLEIPSVACLNLHASLLPRHRGAAPIQAAIVAGDLGTGITVMYMDEGLDTGDILLQSRIKISASETGGSLHDRLAEIAPEALLDALVHLSAGTAPRIAQNAMEATYAPKLERENGRIEWTEPAELIERKVRAYDPWPGAFTFVTDGAGREWKLKVFSAAIVEVTAGPVGTIHRTPEDSLLIAAGDGSVLLQEVQLEGSRRMSAAELLRGHPWIAPSVESIG